MYPEILRHGSGSTANTAIKSQIRSHQIAKLSCSRTFQGLAMNAVFVGPPLICPAGQSASFQAGLTPFEQLHQWHHVGFSRHSQAVHSEGSYSGYACSQQATYLPWITDEVGTTCWSHCRSGPFFFDHLPSGKLIC